MTEKPCFVIAPIGELGSRIRERSDKVLKHIIRPAVAECGYRAFRADEIDQPGIITRQVIRHVVESPLVVADLTGQNPNVFYELAIRHSLRKPLVQMIEKGEQIPFDVAGMRTIQVNHQDLDSVEAARQAIIRQVCSLETGGVELETPISAVVELALREGPLSSYADEKGKIEGKRLFQHEGYYPIDIAPGTNIPSLNPEIYLKAIKYLLEEDNYDRLAAMDLVYLREDNLVEEGDVLSYTDLPLYENLIKRYSLQEFVSNFREENKRVFRNFVRIVNDIGATLKDVYLEILLHDVRNPIRSIIAARNSEHISGRKLYDPSTRFVVQYVKNQGRLLIKEMEAGSKVGYLKQFHHTKQVKATTTPLYHDRYGLIGILCINIDIDAVKGLDAQGRDKFFENYVKNSGYTPRFEKEDWGL